jgi:hypothetical protein
MSQVRDSDDGSTSVVDPRQARDVARWRTAERERLLAARLALSAESRAAQALAIDPNRCREPSALSNRARCPIIALAFRIGGTVEYFALAASCRSGCGGEKAAPVTGLAGIRRLLSVVVQFALLILGLTKGTGFGADEVLFFFSVPNRGPARCSGDKVRRQPPQSSAT